MYEPILETLGLDAKEARVYEHILHFGQSRVTPILRAVPIKRGDLYNVLRRLEQKKLIEPIKDIKKLTYTPTDPQALETLAKAKERKLTEAKDSIATLYGIYNLAMGKPGIRFFEGIDGIKQVLNDSLNATTEILAYSDIDGLLKHLRKYAVWYAAERRRKKIRERAIVSDTPVARKYLSGYNKEVTQIAFVPHTKYRFSLEMNIYDNKVFYATLREPFIAVLIEDKAIADTHRAIFEHNWASTVLY